MARLQIYNLKVSGAAELTPNLGAARVADSLDVVTIAAVVAGTVTAWSWSVTGSPTVSLSGSGNSRSFTAPATVNGAAYTVSAVATIDGVDTNPGTVTVTVRAHQWWVLRASGWQPFTGVVLH